MTGNEARVDAIFRVEQQERVDGSREDGAQDEPYFAKLEKDDAGLWKLVASTSSIFVIDR